MVSISFSLTEKIIIDPVLSLCAPLPPNGPQDWTAQIWNVAESELLARLDVIFISVFAAADALIHLATGVYKGAYLALKDICCLTPATWSGKEVCHHFQRAAFFTGLTIIGSLTGVIWPGVVSYFRYSPPPPPPQDDVTDAPDDLLNLAADVAAGTEPAPFNRVQQFWDNASLEGENWFFRVFNRDGFANFPALRTHFADTIYRPINGGFDKRQIEWLSGTEIDQRIHNVFEEATAHNQRFFFHATSLPALESILRSERVEVRHEKVYRGAFVSTKPEKGFGRFILVFRENIARLSPLEHGFPRDESTYWAGFSHDIPVSIETLAFIAVVDEQLNECQQTAQDVQNWTGRDIPVISLDAVEERLEAIHAAAHIGIPEEWPGDDPQAGLIFNTLQVRAQQAQPVAVPLAIHQLPVGVGLGARRQPVYA